MRARLLWELRLKKEGHLIETRRARKMPDPEWLSSCPNLGQGDDVYFKALWDLDGERQLGGGGIGRIPWTSAMEYAHKRLGMRDEFALNLFWSVLFEMDTGYLEWMSEEHKRVTKDQNAAQVRANAEARVAGSHD